MDRIIETVDGFDFVIDDVQFGSYLTRQEAEAARIAEKRRQAKIAASKPITQ